MTSALRRAGRRPRSAGQARPARLPCCGCGSGRGSRAGTATSASAVPVGTSSAPRSPHHYLGVPLRRPGRRHATWSSPTTRCRRRRRRSPTRDSRSRSAYVAPRHGRARRPEDVEVARQPRARLAAARSRRRPAAIRLALLHRHYRGDWEWTDDLLAEATQAARALARGRRAGGPDASATTAEVRDRTAPTLDAAGRPRAPSTPGRVRRRVGRRRRELLAESSSSRDC